MKFCNNVKCKKVLMPSNVEMFCPYCLNKISKFPSIKKIIKIYLGVDL